MESYCNVDIFKEVSNFIIDTFEDCGYINDGNEEDCCFTDIHEKDKFVCYLNDGQAWGDTPVSRAARLSGNG